MSRHLWTWALVAVLASGSWAAAEAVSTRPAVTTQPVAAPVMPPTADLENRIALTTRRLVEMFRSQKLSERQEAQENLLALQKAYLTAMTAYADDADPEVRARVLDTLADAIAEARIRRALTKVLARTPQRAWQSWYGRESRDQPHMAVLEALSAIKSPRTAPVLLDVIRKKHPSRYIEHALADAFVATGELRAIPLLIDQLKNTRSSGRWSSGSTTITMASCDLPLMILVKLTRQTTSSYGFAYFDQRHHNSDLMFGFSDDKARKAAVSKFRQWWEKHKDDEKYKDLKPLALPGG